MGAQRTLNFGELFNLSLLAFGIQFISTLQLTNMSSIYKFMGAPSAYLPYLGLAAPVAGLIIQPIIGQLSDRTYSRFGRRMPYIILWTIVAFLSVIFLPFYTSLWALIISMWLLNFSINGATEALRALTGDLVPNPQKTGAFSLQTVLAGVSAGFAMLLPSLLDKILSQSFETKTSGIPFSLVFSFIVGVFVWLGTMLWMMKKVEEPFVKHISLLKKKKSTKPVNVWYQTKLIYTNMIRNIRYSPFVIQELGVVQFFAWMGLYIFWMFLGLAFSQHLFGLPPGVKIEDNPHYAALLNQGMLATNSYVSVYQFVSVAYAIVLPFLTKIIPPKKLHGLSVMIGALGIIGLRFFTGSHAIFICMIMAGILWGSIMVLPYVIIASEIPRTRMGVYLGVFNISVTLPQIVAGIILEPVYVFLFQYHAMAIITFSGVLMLMSSLLALFPLTKKNIQRFKVNVEIIWRRLGRFHRTHYQYTVFTDRQKRGLVGFVMLLMTISQLSITLYLPSMPHMVSALQTSRSAIELSLTLYLIGYGCSQFFYGPLSDIYGRRLIILWGLTIFVIASFFCTLTNTIYIFLLARFFQGVGIGCGDTMGRAILCDCFKDKAFVKAASYIGLVATVTPLVAPVIGGYFQMWYGWRLDFIFILCYGLLAITLVFLYLPETKPSEQFFAPAIKEVLNTYKFIITNRIFLGFFIPGLVSFSGEMIYSMMSPFIIQDKLGLGPVMFGWLSIFIVAGLFVGGLLATFLSGRFNHHFMVLNGLCLLVGGGVLMFVPSVFSYVTVFSLIMPMTIFMTGVGVTYPNTNMGALAPFTATAGTAGALQGGLQMVIGGALTYLLNLMHAQSQFALSLALTLLSLTALFSFKLLLRRS